MLPTLVNYLKTKYNTKIYENEEKIHDHDKYITTSDFNKLTKENFDDRLEQANQRIKHYFGDFIRKKNLDEKLRKINDKVTSNKTKQVKTEKELNCHISSYIRLINDLTKQFKLTSTKA